MPESATNAAYPETADIETSSDDYARRFAGATGRWFLDVQARLTLRLLPPGPRLSILDVGGGHGQLAGPLCAAGHRVTVLGSSVACRARLEPLLSGGACTFTVGNVIALPFPDRHFDVAASFRLLPHCARWPQLVAELCRTAGRCVIVDYPARAGANVLADRLFDAKKKLERNTRPWRLFTHAEVVDAFAANGFRPAGRAGQFALPMVLHRALRCRTVSAVLEGGCRALGLTRRWGSPVIARFDRATRP